MAEEYRQTTFDTVFETVNDTVFNTAQLTSDTRQTLFNTATSRTTTFETVNDTTTSFDTQTSLITSTVFNTSLVTSTTFETSLVTNTTFNTSRTTSTTFETVNATTTTFETATIYNTTFITSRSTQTSRGTTTTTVFDTVFETSLTTTFETVNQTAEFRTTLFNTLTQFTQLSTATSNVKLGSLGFDFGVLTGSEFNTTFETSEITATGSGVTVTTFETTVGTRATQISVGQLLGDPTGGVFNTLNVRFGDLISAAAFRQTQTSLATVDHLTQTVFNTSRATVYNTSLSTSIVTSLPTTFFNTVTEFNTSLETSTVFDTSLVTNTVFNTSQLTSTSYTTVNATTTTFETSLATTTTFETSLGTSTLFDTQTSRTTGTVFNTSLTTTFNTETSLVTSFSFNTTFETSRQTVFNTTLATSGIILDSTAEDYAPTRQAFAYVNLNLGSNDGSNYAPRDSYNVSSVSDLGTGSWQLNFQNQPPTANYFVMAQGRLSGSSIVNYNYLHLASTSSCRGLFRTVGGTAVNCTHAAIHVVSYETPPLELTEAQWQEYNNPRKPDMFISANGETDTIYHSYGVSSITSIAFGIRVNYATTTDSDVTIVAQCHDADQTSSGVPAYLKDVTQYSSFADFSFNEYGSFGEDQKLVTAVFFKQGT